MSGLVRSTLHTEMPSRRKLGAFRMILPVPRAAAVPAPSLVAFHSRCRLCSKASQCSAVLVAIVSGVVRDIGVLCVLAVVSSRSSSWFLKLTFSIAASPRSRRRGATTLYQSRRLLHTHVGRHFDLDSAAGCWAAADDMDSVRKALLARAKRLDNSEAVPDVSEGEYLSGEEDNDNDDEGSDSSFFRGFIASSEESFLGFPDDSDSVLGEGVDLGEQHEDLALKAIVWNLKGNPYRD